MARRFPSPITTEDYERMIDQGLLTDCERVELIEGEIVEKMTQADRSPGGDSHAMCVLVLNQLFRFRALDDLLIGVQGPLWLPPDSVPEPELLLNRPAGPLCQSHRSV